MRFENFVKSCLKKPSKRNYEIVIYENRGGIHGSSFDDNRPTFLNPDNYSFTYLEVKERSSTKIKKFTHFEHMKTWYTYPEFLEVSEKSALNKELDILLKEFLSGVYDERKNTRPQNSIRYISNAEKEETLES